MDAGVCILGSFLVSTSKMVEKATTRWRVRGCPKKRSSSRNLPSHRHQWMDEFRTSLLNLIFSSLALTWLRDFVLPKPSRRPVATRTTGAVKAAAARAVVTAGPVPGVATRTAMALGPQTFLQEAEVVSIVNLSPNAKTMVSPKVASRRFWFWHFVYRSSPVSQKGCRPWGHSRTYLHGGWCRWMRRISGGCSTARPLVESGHPWDATPKLRALPRSAGRSFQHGLPRTDRWPGFVQERFGWLIRGRVSSDSGKVWRHPGLGKLGWKPHYNGRSIRAGWWNPSKGQAELWLPALAATADEQCCRQLQRSWSSGWCCRVAVQSWPTLDDGGGGKSSEEKRNMVVVLLWTHSTLEIKDVGHSKPTDYGGMSNL